MVFPLIVEQQKKSSLAGAQLGQLEKTRQNKGLENSWNWHILFVPEIIWQIWNMQCTPWPETEATRICRNLHGKTSDATLGELIFGGFYPFGTTVWRVIELWLRLSYRLTERQTVAQKSAINIQRNTRVFTLYLHLHYFFNTFLDFLRAKSGSFLTILPWF